MGLERRGRVVRPWPLANWKQEEPVDEAKPFRQRSNIGSRVTREGHARFWERPEVKFLRATRHPRATTGAGRTALMRCAPVVVVIGAAWLLLALVIDLLLRLSHPDAWQIYRSGEAWIDLRFYIGWSLGLLLAPAPRET